MQQYKNLNGHSEVTAYFIGNTFIRVWFETGAIYLFNYNSAGICNIEHMKRLAEAGRGLHTFIRAFAWRAYARREQ